FGLGHRLILIDLGDRLLHRADARGGLLGGLLRLVGASSGVHCVSIGIVGLAHGLPNAFGRAGVNVGNHFGVLGGEFIQLIHAAPNRIKLAVDVLLAGEGVDFAPETLMAFVFQWFMTGVHLLIGALRLLRWSGLV